MNRCPFLVYLFAFVLTSVTINAADVEFTIRYYDKKVYFLDSNIYIKAEIFNNGAETLRFKVSPSRVFNIDFDVRTLTNTALERASNFTTKRSSNQPVFYREVTLEPGERYSVVEDLRNFVTITAPGVYVLQGFYYPELYTRPDASMFRSNSLTLSVVPGATEAERAAATIDEESGAILQQLALPPDEVVEYMLRARQRSQWQKFLLYLDLEGLYLQDPDNELEYENRSDEQRRLDLRRFEESLTAETSPEEFLLIPREFEILKTSYTPTEASVLVIEKFRYVDFTEVKEFTYYLRRKDRVWMIYNYEVKNLGTE